MIDAKRVETALVKRAESDEEHAKLKVQVDWLDWQRKHKKGMLFQGLFENLKNSHYPLIIFFDLVGRVLEKNNEWVVTPQLFPFKNSY